METLETALTHRSFVALTPGEMPTVQAEIAAWCQVKLIALGRDLADARQNIVQAKRRKWKSSGWDGIIRKTVKRMLYYAKIKAAVRAGFVIVPNFPVELIAVKVDNERPRHAVATYPSSINTAEPDMWLGPGQGRYVNETLPHEDIGYQQQLPGKDPVWKPLARVGAPGYDEEIDFPVTLVKPVVLKATQRAMCLKIFDTIGLVNQDGRTTSRAQAKSDPIVVGQIIDGSTSKRSGQRRMTFFIAWWLDTRML